MPLYNIDGIATGVKATNKRVVFRYILGSKSVRVVVDTLETLEACQKYSLFTNIIVGTFDQPVKLYRLFDGEELERVLTSGKITGGQYAVRAERDYGASWGSDLSSIIVWGNQVRGRRLGEKLYLAELDANGKQFAHLDPKLEFDPEGPPKQTTIMDSDVCNLSLGCSIVDVHVNEINLYRVEADGKLTSISIGELKKEIKSISKDLRPELREDVRDSSWGLQPKDKLIVDKGSRRLGIEKGYPIRVKDVWQRAGERVVLVKLQFVYPRKPSKGSWTRDNLTLYAIHSNELKQPFIRLRGIRGDFIEVRKK